MTNFTKYMRLLALGITFSASMALPYVHIKFYDVIREATQATNNELGLLMTIFTGCCCTYPAECWPTADRRRSF